VSWFEKIVILSAWGGLPRIAGKNLLSSSVEMLSRFAGLNNDETETLPKFIPYLGLLANNLIFAHSKKETTYAG